MVAGGVSFVDGLGAGFASAPVREWVVAHPEAALVALGFSVVFLIDAIADAPGAVVKMLRWRSGSRVLAQANAVARELRVVSGARFAVLTGPFTHDDAGMLDRLVERALDNHAAGFLFDRQARRARLPLPLDGPNAAEAAREWSRQADADLIVWGQGGRASTLWRIYFLTARARAQNGPVQEIRLIPPQDAAEADRLARGVAYIFARLALPSAEEADRYRPEKLRSVLAALDQVISDPPKGLGEEFERLLRVDAARIALSIGERTNDLGALRRASRLRVRILAEIDRVTKPRDWAEARADLGRVHLAIGQRERDARRLSAAIEAFADAGELYQGMEMRAEYARNILNIARSHHARAEIVGDAGDIKAAIAAYRRALEFADDDGSRFADEARRGLAAALHVLGDAGGELDAFDEAVSLYHLVANDRVKAVEPTVWAQSKHDLGMALMALSAQRRDPQAGYEAVAAFREALRERTRDVDPQGWSQTMCQLGLALFAAGKREPAAGALEAAVRAFREILDAIAPEADPVFWARMQHNLGAALQAIGERDRDRVAYRNAVEAFNQALTVLTAIAQPHEWAAVQNNLGNALHALGHEARDPETLETALKAHRDALSVRTRDRAREDWAATRNNMGLVLMTLAETTGDRRRLQEAMESYRDALGVFRLAGLADYAAMAERNLEHAKDLAGSVAPPPRPASLHDAQPAAQ